MEEKSSRYTSGKKWHAVIYQRRFFSFVKHGTLKSFGASQDDLSLGECWNFEREIKQENKCTCTHTEVIKYVTYLLIGNSIQCFFARKL